MNKTIKIIKSIGAAVMSLVLISMCVLTAFAADSYVTLYGFVFEDNSSGEAVICDYDDRESYVVIPESLLDKPVTKIADYAFYSDTVITNINFEKAVSLHQIGDNAFSKCSGLSSVTIPDNVALGFGAFQRCEGLKSAFMGNTITVIPEQCFYFCPSLEKVYLPDTVTVIEPRAFDGCDNLVIYTPKNSYTYHYAIENDIPVIPTDIEWLLGDSNGDGYVNINDVTIIQRYLAELETLDNKYASDANRDGLIDISDATVIQMYLAEYIVLYPVGEMITW